jgi:hypothetical protein
VYYPRLVVNNFQKWRQYLDPQDPDYMEPCTNCNALDYDDYGDDWEDYDGPEDYEGTARYHY